MNLSESYKNRLSELAGIKNNLNESYEDVGIEYIKNKKPKLQNVINFSDKKVIGDITLLNTKHGNDGWIHAYNNTDETEIGNAFYGKSGIFLKASVDVRPDMRRKGIATEMYKFIEELTGEEIYPDVPHSEKAKKFWSQPNRKFGPNWIKETN